MIGETVRPLDEGRWARGRRRRFSSAISIVNKLFYIPGPLNWFTFCSNLTKAWGEGGAEGAQRLIGALGIETGTLKKPFVERATHCPTTENLFEAKVIRFHSVAGFAEPALLLTGHTPTQPKLFQGETRTKLLSGSNQQT